MKFVTDNLIKLLDKKSEAHHKTREKEIARLKEEIKREVAKLSKGEATGPTPMDAKAIEDLSPSRWIKKLFQDAPSLDGVEEEGGGKKGGQGTTFKLKVGNRTMMAKTDRSEHVEKGNPQCEREFKVYEQLYKPGVTYPNLVRVWGRASIKRGRQHSEGFIMDYIEGPTAVRPKDSSKRRGTSELSRRRSIGARSSTSAGSISA